MFTTSNVNHLRSSSHSHFGKTNYQNSQLTTLANSPIYENIEYSIGSRNGRMTKDQMKNMASDVEQLKNRIKNLMNDENANPNIYPENSNLSASAFQAMRQPKFTRKSSINDIKLPSTNKHLSKKSIPTGHSISLTSCNEISNSYEYFDREIAFQKEKMQLKTKITSLEFQKEHLQRSFSSVERRLDTRDQEIAIMKQRMFLLEEAKHEIDDKQRNWKGMISRLQKQLINSQTMRNDPNIELIFQQKSAETESLRQQLRRKNELVQNLQDHANANMKKFDTLINSYGNEKLELITEIKRLERQNTEITFQRLAEVNILTQQVGDLKATIQQQQKCSSETQKKLI